MTVYEAIALAIASVGAVLGIMNMWHQISRTSVRLRVIPKITWMLGGGKMITGARPHSIMGELGKRRIPSRLSIEIVNLSEFPVTVSDVGFGPVHGDRLTLFQPELTPSKNWPVRLESREAVTAHAGVGYNLDSAKLRKTCAYACTDCGRVVYGSSPVFEEYVNQLREELESGE